MRQGRSNDVIYSVALKITVAVLASKQSWPRNAHVEIVPSGPNLTQLLIYGHRRVGFCLFINIL